eukprot:TRINITY_DN2014_c0_g1_i2.p1 TRINITY_DN2014_c0_g1~~TRINITY_DN2014_c0_g1_i2.p1  ORF type:complete len:190 (+),score=29.16 TRINITY_DN2014_c0_g1_i2:50-619(+)
MQKDPSDAMRRSTGSASTYFRASSAIFILVALLVIFDIFPSNIATFSTLFSLCCGVLYFYVKDTPSGDTETKKPVQYINFSQLGEVSSGDLSIEEELWSAYQESWNCTRSDLEKAFKEGNANEARLHAHSLKGACLSIGFDVLAAICKEMEHLSAQGDVSSAQKLLQKLLDTHEATSASMIEHLNQLRT